MSRMALSGHVSLGAEMRVFVGEQADAVRRRLVSQPGHSALDRVSRGSGPAKVKGGGRTRQRRCSFGGD